MIYGYFIYISLKLNIICINVLLYLLNYELLQMDIFLNFNGMMISWYLCVIGEHILAPLMPHVVKNQIKQKVKSKNIYNTMMLYI